MINISKELEETKTEMLHIIEKAIQDIKDKPELIIDCIEEKIYFSTKMQMLQLKKLTLELVTYKVVENNFKTK